MAVTTNRLLVGAAALALGMGIAGAAAAAEPVGYLDSASCDGIAGWAQDPDEPAKGIDVHIYMGGPAGTPGVPAAATPAINYREDLCGAIGSCEHGFWMMTPLSLHDGNPRDIYAYGIDSMGGPNPVLGATPKVLACPPGPQAGVRRRVDGVPTYDAWRFSSFWDLLPLGEQGAAIPDGPPLPAKPELVRADDGTEAVWLVDGGVRRAVTGAVAATWRFDLAAAEVRPAAEVSALVEGTPLRPRPLLFVHGALYLIDDPQPEGQGAASSSSAASAGAGGAGGAGGAAGDGGAMSDPSDDPDGSCAVHGPRGRSSFAPIVSLVISALLAVRRRRRASL